MASINGNWFHSRTSSYLSELLTVRAILIESRKIDYVGFNWRGARENIRNGIRVRNEKMFALAGVGNVSPSQMQTKTNNFIRLGFIIEDSFCPLKWTRLGELWNDLYTVGNYDAASQVYQLTLSTSLAIYAFNDTPTQYSINPVHGDMPLKFLLNHLDNNVTNRPTPSFS